MKTWYLLWITLQAVLVDAQIPAVETITIASDLSTERECVRWCAGYSNFGCAINSCYCAPYIRHTINSFVSACVTRTCPDSSDIEAATNAVSSYCNNYYAALGSTPSAAPTSGIQDTSINGELHGKIHWEEFNCTDNSLVLPGATPTSAPSASATSNPGSTSSTDFNPTGSPISNTIKIVGIVIGGVITLFGGLLLCWGMYKSCTLRRNERKSRQAPPPYDSPGQTGAAPTSKIRKRLLLAAAIVGAFATIAGTVATIYFGVKRRA